MKLGYQMSEAEKAVFRARPDVQAEYQQFFEYFRMLRPEIDAMYEGRATNDDYYCYLRGALGFDHPSMRDMRAPALQIIGPYILEEINVVCKKPRVTSVNGHLIVPQVIHNLNMNGNNGNSNNGYLTNAIRTYRGGSKRRHKKSRQKRKQTRRNNRG